MERHSRYFWEFLKSFKRGAILSIIYFEMMVLPVQSLQSFLGPSAFAAEEAQVQATASTNEQIIEDEKQFKDLYKQREFVQVALMVAWALMDFIINFQMDKVCSLPSAKAMGIVSIFAALGELVIFAAINIHYARTVADPSHNVETAIKRFASFSFEYMSRGTKLQVDAFITMAAFHAAVAAAMVVVALVATYEVFYGNVDSCIAGGVNDVRKAGSSTAFNLLIGVLYLLPPALRALALASSSRQQNSNVDKEGRIEHENRGMESALRGASLVVTVIRAIIVAVRTFINARILSKNLKGMNKFKIWKWREFTKKEPGTLTRILTHPATRIVISLLIASMNALMASYYGRSAKVAQDRKDKVDKIRDELDKATKDGVEMPTTPDATTFHSHPLHDLGKKIFSFLLGDLVAGGEEERVNLLLEKVTSGTWKTCFSSKGFDPECQCRSTGKCLDMLASLPPPLKNAPLVAKVGKIFNEISRGEKGFKEVNHQEMVKLGEGLSRVQGRLMVRYNEARVKKGLDPISIAPKDLDETRETIWKGMVMLDPSLPLKAQSLLGSSHSQNPLVEALPGKLQEGIKGTLAKHRVNLDGEESALLVEPGAMIPFRPARVVDPVQVPAPDYRNYQIEGDIHLEENQKTLWEIISLRYFLKFREDLTN